MATSNYKSFSGLCNGFSLIEMMIVVAIVGIIAAVGAPAFSTWIADTKTRTVAEALQNGLREAQTEAVRRGVQVEFALTNDSPTVKDVAKVATGRNWVIQTMKLTDATATEFFVKGAELASVSSTSLVSNSPGSIRFNSLGRMVDPAGPATFNLVNAKGTRKLNITVTIAGKIRMCDPEKSITTSPDACS